MYGRLLDVLAARPTAVVVRTRDGDVNAACQDVVAALSASLRALDEERPDGRGGVQGGGRRIGT
jgi:hypothetical protein